MDFKHEIGNDCAFDSDKTKDEFCSPYIVINKIKELTNTKGLPDKEAKSQALVKYNCTTEICVLKHPEVRQTIGSSVDTLIEEGFKPEGPRDNTQWFSNTNIDDILAQNQKKYTERHFLHIPFQMIDFEDEKVNSELARLDWPAKYKEGYRTFGTVFNTDNSRGRGKHWFAMYGSFEDADAAAGTYTLEYFNSAGDKIIPSIREWMERTVAKWLPNFAPTPIIAVNATEIENQKDNHSCGSYSLYYIISRLSGVPYQDFENLKIGDKNMHEFRKYLFRQT